MNRFDSFCSFDNLCHNKHLAKALTEDLDVSYGDSKGFLLLTYKMLFYEQEVLPLLLNYTNLVKQNVNHYVFITTSFILFFTTK